MKRQYVFFVVLLLSLFAFSCKKPASNSPQPPDGLVYPGKLIVDTVPLFSADTCGALHNELLQEYYDLEGFDTTSVDTLYYEDVYTIVFHLTSIFIDKVNWDNDSLLSIANRTMAEYWSMGIFNADSTLKSMDSVNLAFISQITNLDVRDVWNYVALTPFDSYEEMYDYTATSLQAITGLSTSEQWGNDGSLSVMEDSYDLFLGKTEAEIAKDVARADAWSFGQYWNSTNTFLWWVAGLDVRLAYCALRSSEFSALQLKLRLQNK